MRVWRLYREKVIISIVLGLIVAVRGDAQSFSLSNNVVYSATLTPNLGFETRVDSTWTVGLWGGFRPWPTDDKALRKYRHLSLDLYTRKWTGGTPWRGFYYGLMLCGFTIISLISSSITLVCLAMPVTGACKAISMAEARLRAMPGTLAVALAWTCRPE